MTKEDKEQLNIEISHIFESGANHLRIFEMVENFIDKRYKAINYTRCCEELKDKKPLTFKEWKKVNKYTICTDETWFVSPEVGYITTKELKKRYKKHYNL
jgi:hypothetical protein